MIKMINQIFLDVLEFAVNHNGPVAIRYPRGGEGKNKYENSSKIELGKAELINEGNDLTIAAIGKMADTAVKVKDILRQKDIEAEVINVRFLKPIDEKAIIESINKTNKVITIEDNLLKGGLSDTILELVNKNKLNVHVQSFGYNDMFIQQGTVEELEKKFGLDAESIAEKIEF